MEILQEDKFVVGLASLFKVSVIALLLHIEVILILVLT